MDELCKIEIRLSPAARQGGFETESLWARPVGNGLYELQSIPFFEYNLKLKDVVRCESEADGLRFVEVVKASGQETLRVFFGEEAAPEFVVSSISYIRKRGGVVEPGAERMFAVSVPSWTILEEVDEELSNRDTEGWISFESGSRKRTPSN